MGIINKLFPLYLFFASCTSVQSNDFQRFGGILLDTSIVLEDNTGEFTLEQKQHIFNMDVIITVLMKKNIDLKSLLKIF